MVSLDDMIKGKWIEGEQLSNPGPKFIEQLADLLAELHSLPHGPHFARYSNVPESSMKDNINDLVNWSDKDIFCEDALYDLYAIKSLLNKRFYLHGDLWKQNIIVDEQGNLNGLRDWESFSYGDPHWDFRMIRRWIGWEGLDKLLFLYNCSVNWNCKREYIEILDKISLCHSIRIRKERGLLRHDKPDAIELFENYKKLWPLDSLPASGEVELMLGANGEMPTTIYVPKETGTKPLVLVIHTSSGMLDTDHDYARALTKEGYISVVPDFFTAYNLSNDKKRLTWTKYKEDIHKDFTTIISQVKSMSKSPSKKVFVVGFSNGGYWAGALAVRGDIDAGVSYYGAYSEGGTVRGRSEIESGSIIREVSSKSTPLLMFHGTKDSIVPLQTAKTFESLYPNVEAHYYEDVDHAYERESRLNSYDEEATKKSWEKTLKFLLISSQK